MEFKAINLFVHTSDRKEDVRLMSPQRRFIDFSPKKRTLTVDVNNGDVFFRFEGTKAVVEIRTSEVRDRKLLDVNEISTFLEENGVLAEVETTLESNPTFQEALAI